MSSERGADDAGGDLVAVPRERLLELAPGYGTHCPKCLTRSFKTRGGKLVCDSCQNNFERGSVDNCIVCNGELGDGRDAVCLACFVDDNLPDSNNDY